MRKLLAKSLLVIIEAGIEVLTERIKKRQISPISELRHLILSHPDRGKAGASAFCGAKAYF